MGQQAPPCLHPVPSLNKYIGTCVRPLIWEGQSWDDDDYHVRGFNSWHQLLRHMKSVWVSVQLRSLCSGTFLQAMKPAGAAFALGLVPGRATCNACRRRLRWQAPLLPSYQWFCWNTTLALNQLQWNGRLWENKLPPNISLTSFPLVALLVSVLGFMGHFVLFFFLLLLILILVPPGVVLSEDSSHEFSDGSENWDRDLTVFSLLFFLCSVL